MTRVYFIGGFGETDFLPTGQGHVARETREVYDDRPGIDIEPLRPWKSDWKGLAAMARRDGITRVIEVGYSWGGGFGAQKLAGYLKEEGIDVELQILCDPVYRPLWLPTCGPANVLGFKALLRWGKIKVPDNVAKVVGVRQQVTRPAGHPIKHHGSVFTLPLVENTTHRLIDNSPEWIECVRSNLKQALT